MKSSGRRTPFYSAEYCCKFSLNLVDLAVESTPSVKEICVGKLKTGGTGDIHLQHTDLVSRSTTSRLVYANN